jgi:hypothetical protein
MNLSMAIDFTPVAERHDVEFVPAGIEEVDDAVIALGINTLPGQRREL